MNINALTIVKSTAGKTKTETPAPEDEPEVQEPSEEQEPIVDPPVTPAEPQPSAIRGLLWAILGGVSAAAIGVLTYAGILLAKKKKA